MVWPGGLLGSPSPEAAAKEEVLRLQQLSAEVQELRAGQLQLAGALEEVRMTSSRTLELLLQAASGGMACGWPQMGAGEWSPPCSPTGPCSPKMRRGATFVSEASSMVALPAVLSLPRAWPASIKMREGFQQKTRSSSDLLPQVGGRHSSHGRRSAFRSLGSTRGSRLFEKRRLPLDPRSPTVVAFDVVGMWVLVYDLLVTPFMCAWDVPFGGWTYFVACTSACYWTLRIAVSFNTGFYCHGELSMSQPQIAWYYLKHRFSFDVALVVADWVTLGIRQKRAKNWVQAIMLLRLVRVLRLAVRVRMLDKIWAHRFGHRHRANIFVKVAFVTLVGTHMTCCAWYALGRARFSDTGGRWPEALAEAEMDTAIYTYLTSFHWALSQVMQGSIGGVDPKNSFERAFAVMLMVCGFFFNSIVVALVSTQAMEYVTARREKVAHMSNLDKFLAQSGVGGALAGRVRGQARQRVVAEAPISERSVAALPLLSADLRCELLRTIRMPHMLSHPLFRTWAEADGSALQHLCDEAVCFLALAPQDCAFMPGTLAVDAFCVIRGQLCYVQDPETAPVAQRGTTQVNEKAWISEAALWSHWVHVGKLTAETACQLLVVSASGLQEVMGRHRAIAPLTRSYAQAYCVRIGVATPPFSSWPTDINVPCTDPSDLLSSNISVRLLQQERSAGRLDIAPGAFESLTEQVLQEKCAIVSSTETGELQRVVFVCALRLERHDEGSILVEVGSAAAGEGLQAKCRLPGTERDRGELPREALKRFLEQDLATFCSTVRLSHSEEEVELRPSEHFGIMTRYLRTVNYASVPAGFMHPEWPVIPYLGHLPPPWPRSGRPGGGPRLEELCQHEVFGVRRGRSTVFYSWLSPAVFEALRSPEGQQVLVEWTACLQIDSVVHECL